MRKHVARTVLASVLALTSIASAQDATFRGMGYSGMGASLVGSRADALSPDGLVATGGDDTDMGTLVASWDEFAFFPEFLRDPDGNFTPGRGVAVSELGLVTVGGWNTFRDGTFVRLSMAWQLGQLGVELQPLPDALPLSGTYTVVGDLNGHGSLAVGVSFDEARRRQPVSWDPASGAVDRLPLLQGRTGGQANRISTDGRIIFGSQFGGPGGVDRIVLWTDGVPQAADATLPDGYADFTILGISPDASVVTGTLLPIDYDPFTNPAKPAVWREDTGIEILDTIGPAGFRLIDDAVNDASEHGGLMVGTVGVFVVGGPYAAAVWFEDGSVRLLQEWLVDEFGLFEAGEWRGLLEATSISDDGTIIVGYGINQFGIKEAFRVTLPRLGCEVDFDEDGSLTIFDFLAFQNLFDDRHPRADMDGDGQFTLFDFLAFQTQFDAGCE
ncbi:MAG: GC-type dockerin domain-anchored protein [Phycisphaerales bacterium]|jgi:hypothetical protein